MARFIIARFKNRLTALGFRRFFYEKKFTALEKKEADALEVAEKEDEEREEKEEAQGIDLKV